MDAAIQINAISVIENCWSIFKQQLPWIICIGAVFSSLFLMVIFPLFFNFVIIPKIEKKIGKKLPFNWYIYQLSVYPRIHRFFGKYGEIVLYIVQYTIGFKKGLKRRQFFSLTQVNYNREQMSFFEIFMCYFVAIIALVWIICISLACILPSTPPP